jgi:hypothetical protein
MNIILWGVGLLSFQAKRFRNVPNRQCNETYPLTDILTDTSFEVHLLAARKLAGLQNKHNL